jgi:hypothetical protein
MAGRRPTTIALLLACGVCGSRALAAAAPGAPLQEFRFFYEFNVTEMDGVNHGVAPGQQAFTTTLDGVTVRR